MKKVVTIHLRNMCCNRCIEAVTDELQKAGVKVESVTLGTVTYYDDNKISLAQIESSLNKRGFVVMVDAEEILVEKIKTTILDLVHHLSDVQLKDFSLPTYLEHKVSSHYRSMAKVFSKNTGLTIEKYFIRVKIEKAKDLVVNSNLLFSEIYQMLGYRTLQHLSSQFKKTTGQTMQEFKKTGKGHQTDLNTI